MDNALTYGKGLYFTDKACKAKQYTRGDGVLLLCRVVLGRQEELAGECPQKLFPAYGHDSAMAKANRTAAPTGYPQLHNEYIVYDECACYPEFVIHFEVC